jgi:predicted transcriptional regulator
MKWIKTRQQWLNEAKIRDVILPRQAKEVASHWGEKYLDYEEITPTDKIKQGSWKLDEEDKLKVLSAFFDCNMGNVMALFSNLPDRFNSVLAESIKPELLGEAEKTVLHELNIQAPTVDQMVFIFENVFRKLDLNQTRATEMIQKDENGVPVRDEQGNMIRIKKNAGDPIFTNNLVNINTFVDDYNRCYTNETIDVNFQNRDLSQLRNLAKENHNRDYNYEFSIFGKDLYLQIDHNPKDILNMSISKFYSSCQHLYSGGYRSQLLGNVFDPNSIPAILLFDSPIIWKDEKISDKLPLSRMMIRNIETFDENGADVKISFDRAYPDRMENVFGEIVEKYSGNKRTIGYDETYIFSPDIDYDDELDSPYMDRMRSRREKFIGVNTKTLYLSSAYDWSKTKIAPNAKIKELIIETTDIPENLLDINIDLEWIKFKNLKIRTLDGFEKLKTDSIAFDKCKFDSNLFTDLEVVNPNIKKLQIVSCQVNGEIRLSEMTNIEELHLIYSLDSIEEVKEAITNSKVKKLVISGDIVSSNDAKSFISELRRKGIKVEIVGPVI